MAEIHKELVCKTNLHISSQGFLLAFVKII